MRYEPLLNFARECFGRNAAVSDVSVEPLRGGLEAAGIVLVKAAAHNGETLGSFVVKPIAGDAIREYRIHSEIRKLDREAAAPGIRGSRQEPCGCLVKETTSPESSAPQDLCDSGVSRTKILAMVLTFLPSFLLSGFMYAISNMPPPIQVATHLIPARYFVALLKGIYLKGIGLEVLALEGGLLALFGGVMLVLANVKFRKKLV